MNGTAMQRAFDVYLNGKEIDTVFYSADAPVDADEVRRSLINHDGYDSRIEVREYRQHDNSRKDETR